MEKGLVLVNTGPGKGKTSAACGVAIRALGQGFKVAFLQFIKSQDTGESLFFEKYAGENPGRLFYQRLGLGFVFDAPSPEDKAKAAEALAKAAELTAGGYDLVVLDEICVALSKGLLETDEVIKMIESRQADVNLILTGRGCPAEIIALADTVTEMTEIKHAYQAGVKARRGIEY